MAQKTEYPPIYETLIECLQRDFPLLTFTPAKDQTRDDFVYNGGQQSVIDKLRVIMKSQKKKNLAGGD